METTIKELVSKMTLEEKAAMCSGADFWHTESVERLGIPAVMVSDGPHGLRKQEQESDHLGMNDSIKAVCFPAACATACSFDKKLMYDMGVTLGKECQAEDVSILLGPAVNIKRSPLCGRNFEYVSEDPYVAGVLSTNYIAGVQSQHVGTSMKHFAANNQEYRRMTCSSNMDERTLREIYLPAFETAVKEVQPWTLMCSYNQLNGTFVNEHKKLLTDILRDEWGFDGYVMSDWGAVNRRVPGIQAGLDLEMPGSNGSNDALIIQAVKEGTLSEEMLNTSVERILTKTFAYAENRKGGIFDRDADHEIAAQIERECIVLLKNQQILPLTEKNKIAFIGEFAKKPRYQGGGSSHINSHKVTSALDAVKGNHRITYAQGYITAEDRTEEALLQEAVTTAQNAEIAVLFVGLPDAFESEGYDRKHLNMPNCQNELIEKVCEVQPNTVVVLHNGSPVTMPWIDKVKAVIEVYLGGQAVGEATVDILFGKANPCGKLAETFPLRMEDTPSYLTFPGNGVDADYQEGIFVGYRWYDARKMEVLFPFGYGLSYTNFAYSNLKLSQESMKDTDTVTVSVDITNTGTVSGKEIIQLYVSDRTGAAVRPVKELKAFEKVLLDPGETKRVFFTLGKRAFAWYNSRIKDWYCAPGTYEILIGKSSREIVLHQEILLTESSHKTEITSNSCCGDILKNPKMAEILLPYVEGFTGVVGSDDGSSREAISEEMANSMLNDMPIRALRSFDGSMTNEKVAEIVEKLNALQ